MNFIQLELSDVYRTLSKLRIEAAAVVLKIAQSGHTIDQSFYYNRISSADEQTLYEIISELKQIHASCDQKKEEN